MIVWLVEELDGGTVAGSLIGFLESSGKSSHTVSHYCSISVMSICRLAWKEDMIKLIEVFADQRVGKSVGGSKGLNGLWAGSSQGN